MYSLLLKRLHSALGLHCIRGVRTYPAFSTQKDTHISRVEESTSGVWRDTWLTERHLPGLVLQNLESLEAE